MYTMYDLAGDCYLGVVLNSTVHVLMYSHYFVAALGMSTPWKPFLTQMQLLQVRSTSFRCCVGETAP